MIVRSAVRFAASQIFKVNDPRSAIVSTIACSRSNRAMSTFERSGEPIRFSSFDVTQQVFLQRKHSIGIVNLKPIVPLHVLVITRKPYERVSEVPKEELGDLFEAVQEASNVVQRLTGGTSCTISIQDGKEAGQSVPHLHVHVLPRKVDDFSPKDVIYQHLEKFGLGLYRDMQGVMQRRRLGDSGGVDADEDRKPRSDKEMAEEAEWLRTFF